MRAGNALVDVNTCLSVATETSIARTTVRKKRVCTNRVFVATRSGLALIYVFTNHAVSLRASSAAANMASLCILTISMLVALMAACRALIYVNAGLPVAAKARLAGAFIARVVV